MLGAPLLEVWGEDFNTKPKRAKKKRFKKKPLSPEEMDSELLIRDGEKHSLASDQERVEMLRDDRQDYYTYQSANQLVNPNIVTRGNPYGRIPNGIQDDPDYKEFMEFKSMKNRRRFIEEQENKHISAPTVIHKSTSEDQFNELLLYVFTGFFLLILYDNIYRLGKDSY